MRILALDVATKTGWCVMFNGTVIESGVQEFVLERGASNGIRFLRFRSWLQGMLDFKPNLIVYELAHHRGGAATELCVGFTTRVQEIAAEFNIEHMGVHSATLKKFITGSGRAEKKEVITAVKKRLGINPKDDNEADAAALACYANEKIGGN